MKKIRENHRNIKKLRLFMTEYTKIISQNSILKAIYSLKKRAVVSLRFLMLSWIRNLLKNSAKSIVSQKMFSLSLLWAIF